MRRLLGVIVALFLALSLLTSAAFTVPQNETALIFRMGKLQRTIITPGLHFKLPGPLQQVVLIDRRLRLLELETSQQFVAQDKTALMANAYVRWRVANPDKYYQSLDSDLAALQNRLRQGLVEALSEEISTRAARDVLGAGQEAVAAGLRNRMKTLADASGVEIVEARIRQAGYGDEVREAVLGRMRDRLVADAAQLRMDGETEVARIRDEGVHESGQITAIGYRDAEKIRGDGAAAAAEIYSRAYSQDPDFYRFYRGIETFSSTFGRERDTLVIDSNSDFFRFLKSPVPTQVK